MASMQTLKEIADVNFELAAVIHELACEDDAFGLEAGVDDNEIGINRNYFSGDHFTGTHFLACQALFK